MELKFYDKNDVLRFVCSPEDSSSHTCGIMSDNALNLSFTLPAFYNLNVGDYVFFMSGQYVLDQNYVPKKVSTVEWKYDVGLYAPETLIRDTLVLNTDMEPSYSLTAAAREHVKLVVDNINRRFGSTDWKVGEVIVSDNITIDYNGTYCTKALAQIAEAANTEYWIDGNTVNLCRCEYGEAVELGYMSGLRSLEKTSADNTKFFTRLFPIGSTRNIYRNKYGFSRLQLPGKEKYREQNTEFGVIEYFEESAFTGIYPRRTGTVGSVRDIEKTGEDGNTFTIYYFTDPNIPFDPNDYEIGGLVKTVTFVTGELSGRDFDVNYDSVKKEFEIITQFPYDDMQLPGGVLIPKAGDKYNLFNISMPDEYYALAEQEYSEAVDAYLLENKYDKAVYKASTDYIDITKRDITLSVGMRVRLTDGSYFPSGYRDSRISKITRKVNNPNEADIEISDLLNKGKIATIENGIDQVTSYAKEAMAGLPDVVKSWEGTPASDSNIYSGKKTERELGRKLSKEADDVAKGLIQFEKGAKFGTDIVPGLLGGYVNEQAEAEFKSLTLREFLNVPELRYNRVSVIAGEQWSAPGGGIIERVDASANVFTLKLEPGEIPAIAVNDICKGIYNTGEGFQTVFFKIVWFQQTGDEWQVEYSLKPGAPTHPKPYMHFVAYGNTIEKSRQKSVVRTRAYERYLSGVNTWDISASMIMMQLGDLSGLSINGINYSGYSGLFRNIYFDGVLGQTVMDDINSNINENVNNFADSVLNPQISNLQAQLDGVTAQWFYAYTPSKYNYPSNMWTTDELKRQHNGDTFTNTQEYVDDVTTPDAGKSWRWADKTSDGDWDWITITDSDATKALLLAAKAQDTADGKRRSFVVTPYTPYDEGDLWVQGGGGDIMRCIKRRLSGSYVASDWDKACNYTDDSAVENMVIGGSNLVLDSAVNQTSNAYGFAERKLSKPLTLEKEYTLVVNGRISQEAHANGYKLAIYIDWHQQLMFIDGTSDETKSVTFKLKDFVPDASRSVIRAFYYPDGGTRLGDATVNWYALYEGNKAPVSWSPAPEDVESQAVVLEPRGEYNNTAIYLGNRFRRSVVWITNTAMASGREYYTAKVTAGEFSGVPVSNKNYWETRGANFEITSTKLAITEESYVENEIIVGDEAGIWGKNTAPSNRQFVPRFFSGKRKDGAKFTSLDAADVLAGTTSSLEAWFVVGRYGKIYCNNVDMSGVINAVGGTFNGVLKGVTGSFKRLVALSEDGKERAAIGFNESEGKMYFEGDMQHQGYDSVNKRSYRFLTSDVWCRGVFGHFERATLDCENWSLQDIYISLYNAGSVADFKPNENGLPIDVVNCKFKNNANVYLQGVGKGKKVTIVNLTSGTLRVWCFGNEFRTIPNWSAKEFVCFDGGGWSPIG